MVEDAGTSLVAFRAVRVSDSHLKLVGEFDVVRLVKCWHTT